MNTIRQSVRPKHQMLILKCYPRFQKNAVEVKPNSSELSYLTYYASTRRSKLPKVGAFLEKKTISDVWRLRTGNVQVTLQIVKALVEKCYRDLPLYSQSILNILDTVLKSNDAILIEESVATFDAFVSHYDTATLAADVEHARQFEDIIRQYTTYASKHNKINTKPAVSFPLALRYRSAGLLAIKALVSSAAFASNATRHASIIMPAVLDNTYSDQASYLSLLQYREDARERSDKDLTARKRPSMQNPRSTMDLGEGDALAAVGTTADLDQKAEEEVGALALQCLRQIFRADNRNAIRVATSALIEYGWSKDKIRAGIMPSMDDPPRRSWTNSLFELVCQWAPIQDRFMILVTVMETLIHSPIKEQDIPRQLFLTSVIDSLLRSSVNLIGLSVMDVLLGLVQHVLLVLQLGGATSRVQPHQQQADSVPPVSDPKAMTALTTPAIAIDMEIVQEPTVPRLLLVQRLRTAIGDLATHIYYADQVGDMVAALLIRLKPSPSSLLPTPAAAIADPMAAADAVASSAQLLERPHTDGFFSFDTARLLALNAVRDIIVVANSRRKDGYTHSSGRNIVDVSAWNGTQWLLRDQDSKVRRAYVEAFLTWLNLETTSGSTRLPTKMFRSMQNSKLPGDQSALSKRAVSNASQMNSGGQAQRSSFLQLLHLAVYEHALQSSDCEADILLLHLLLTQCVVKLGINAVRAGLPMIFRLQEDIQMLSNAEGKVCVGSLVHGYFWTLSDAFRFETSSIGRAIFMEIDRRTKTGAWLETVHLPPLPLGQIPASHSEDTHHIDAHVAATASLKPFDARKELVDCISESYPVTVLSPPSSPPISPARVFSSSGNVHGITRSTQTADQMLPSVVKEELLTLWTKEDCIAAAERDLHRASSLSGSRVGSVKNYRSLLAANNGYGSSDTLGLDVEGARLSTPAQDGMGSRSFSPSRSVGSESDRHSVVRVSHLKEVLAGTRSSARPSTAYRLDDPEDTASESMVSVDPAASNVSLLFADASNHRGAVPLDVADPGAAIIVNEPHPRKLSFERERSNASRGDDDIPPVPTISASTISRALSAGSEDFHLAKQQLSSVGNTARDATTDLPSFRNTFYSKTNDAGKADLQLLLSGAKLTARSRPMSTMGRPPY